jgi:hypothetical protein
MVMRFESDIKVTIGLSIDSLSERRILPNRLFSASIFTRFMGTEKIAASEAETMPSSIKMTRTAKIREDIRIADYSFFSNIPALL